MASTPTDTAITEPPPPVRVLSLSVRAGEVFANHAKALDWLQTPNPSLQGKTPIEAAKTEAGSAEADEILTRIEHGVLDRWSPPWRSSMTVLCLNRPKLAFRS